MAERAVTVYDPIAKALHWVIALAIFVMFGTAVLMDAAPDDIKPAVYMAHKSTGMLVLLLMLARVVWFAFHARPPLPEHMMPRWQILAARFVHACLYLLGILAPLIGWALVSTGTKGLSLYGLFDLPLLPLAGLVESYPDLRGALSEAHEVLATLFAIFIVVHIGATILHHFVDRDDVLLRIAPDCAHRWLRRLRGN